MSRVRGEAEPSNTDSDCILPDESLNFRDEDVRLNLRDLRSIALSLAERLGHTYDRTPGNSETTNDAVILQNVHLWVREINLTIVHLNTHDLYDSHTLVHLP